MNASMNASPLVSRILRLSPCEEAKIWLSAYDDPTKAWAECPRGDWMLWLVGRQVESRAWSDERKPLVACALDCALTVRHLWPENLRDEMAVAVETMQAWCRGEASLDAAKAARETLNRASAVSAAVACAASSAAVDGSGVAYSASASAVYAAAVYADAAVVVDAAIAAADDAADTAYADATASAAIAARAAAAVDARAAALSKMQTTTADIVRRHYPHPPACAAS